MASQQPPIPAQTLQNQPPQQPQQQGAGERPLNVRDALSYLDQVKVQFSDQPDVYNRFLDVMKEFKGQTIDTPGVIDRVSTLFHSHPALIQGFNTFLPPGYRIECYTSTDPADIHYARESGGLGTQEGGGVMMISVTTPSGTVNQRPGGFAKAERDRLERLAEGERIKREEERKAGGDRPVVKEEQFDQQQRDAQREHREREISGINHPLNPLSNAAHGMRRDERSVIGFEREPHQDPRDPRFAAPPSTTLHAYHPMHPPSAHQTSSAMHDSRSVTPASRQGSRLQGTAIDPPAPSNPASGHMMMNQPPPPARTGALGVDIHHNPHHAAAPAAPHHHSRMAGTREHSVMAPAPMAAPPRQEPAQPASASGTVGPMVEFNHAIAFVNKIKNRFSGDPDTYKQFLEILQTYQKETKDIQEVYAQVTDLFQGAPDLLDEFSQFLPTADGSQPPPGGLFGDFFGGCPPAPVPVATHAPETRPAPYEKQKRGAKNQEKETGGAKKRRMVDKEGKGRKKAKPANDTPPIEGEPAPAPLPSANTALANLDEVVFFERVKKQIDDRPTYHEFLKLLNLYTNDLIDGKILVERAMLFLGEDSDLAQDFKMLLRLNRGGPAVYGIPANPPTGMISLDPLGVAENLPMLERPKVDLNGQRASGPSYRKLPKSEVNLSCSGRDPMCWEVLNDEWVSHPTWASEDSVPSAAHKRNAYEEALHKTEEERHEYDYHVEANVRTIALLEPIAARLREMDPSERETFRLKPGLGGQSKSIYQRILKKIYGREQGLQVIQALHEKPAMAVPVVLARLKAKDDEWKRAQREWNKVWREVDAKNFYKSLDHQGVVFKANDKKVISQKTMIAEVEALRKEQTQKRIASGDHSFAAHERGQYKFAAEDVECLQDSLKLVFSYLDRVTSHTAAERDRVEAFLRSFIPLFFQFDGDFDAAFADMAVNGRDDDDSEDGSETQSNADDEDRAQKRNRKNASDLRTKLLRQVVEAGGSVALRAATPGDSTDDAEMEAPEVHDIDEGTKTWVDVDAPSSAAERPKIPRRYTFFGNNQFFCMIRLLQMLYSRLKVFKDISAAHKEPIGAPFQPVNPVAVELGLSDPAAAPFLESNPNPVAHFYGHLLDQCEKLFDNDVDAATFEETIRYMYGTQAYPAFTLDKVIAGLVKQVISIINDVKSQDLVELLKADREAKVTSTKQQIAYRMAAEGVLSADENMYKIDWLPTSQKLRVLLLAKEDVTVDDLQTAEQKWEAYIDSYALAHPTEGLRHRVDPPFMQRTLQEEDEEQIARQTAHTGMGVKISLGTYRMFFVDGGEDFYCRRGTAEQAAADLARAKEQREQEVQALRELADKHAGDIMV
ncbi:hypothetical protein QFC20_007014 [Naganishia adeliensis]|uniref:Uncharacterized protein n=1 Tax=Naganishia adeliensis TaxID=92952 RepID=A0ACC2V4D9_9TREE|nr:hypothetical protein QFC20_007014 [Naganishia adeliensis]